MPDASSAAAGERPAGELAVVVVAYGPPGPLGEALTALGGAYPVTIVDNSSSPEVAALAHDHGAAYVDPGANLGFAGGVNVALARLALPDADVLLLNPDARVTPEDVDALWRALRGDPRVGAVAPAQREPGSPARTPSVWPWHSPARAWAEATGLARRRPARTFLSGAVLLLRGAALAEVGLFDDRFFLYAEEEDWQRRALDAGWTLQHCSEITAVHAAGGTDADPERVQLRIHAAIERYIRKWYGSAGWQCYRVAVVSGQLVRGILRGGRRGRRAMFLARLYVTGPDRAANRAGVLAPAGARPRRAGRSGPAA